MKGRRLNGSIRSLQKSGRNLPVQLMNGKLANRQETVVNWHLCPHSDPVPISVSVANYLWKRHIDTVAWSSFCQW